MFRSCSGATRRAAAIGRSERSVWVQEIARAGRFKQVVKREGSVEAALVQFADVDVFDVDPTDSAGTYMSLIGASQVCLNGVHWTKAYHRCRMWIRSTRSVRQRGSGCCVAGRSCRQCTRALMPAAVCAGNCLFRAVLLGLDGQALKVSKKVTKHIGVRPKHCTRERDDPRPGRLRELLKQRMAEVSTGREDGDRLLERIRARLLSDMHGNRFVEEEAAGILARLLHVEVGVLSCASYSSTVQATLYAGEVEEHMFGDVGIIRLYSIRFGSGLSVVAQGQASRIACTCSLMYGRQGEQLGQLSQPTECN